jgi:hypothetical protein
MFITEEIANKPNNSNEVKSEIEKSIFMIRTLSALKPNVAISGAATAASSE